MSDSNRVQDILVAASELPPEQRSAFLDAQCGGDVALRAEVESLLRSLDQAGQFLSSPTSDVPAQPPATVLKGSARIPSPIDESAGTRIGPYKLLQLIGEGGFGTVFMAEQEKPVVRKVALKIIKLGMDTRQVVARFEQERQALAMMDHANIARVFDAGATETGRPFFVMELVKGDPIVEYCDKNNLSIEDRLELFAQVCNAVQHAHTKGIIHRDIKPSNILVSTQDGRPHTKVIDFGIAKATASKLTEKTLFTEMKQLIGTPEYMSPEQAEGNLDIDTRTDVYSLGVLLYELLTGTTPFSARELRSAAYAEIQRIIREVEPPKPSTRLSNNTDTIASVAANRRTEPRKLGTLVRGELDWIVMKALEKDRQRRYETANGLATDVRRYLSGEAVVAAPPSAVYRARKFVRRNRVMVMASSAVALALVLGLAGTAWQANRAAAQRDDAIAAREGEKQQRLAAEVERSKADKIAEFMSEMLKGVGPSVARGRDITMLKEMMDAAAARIDNGDLRDSPDAELRLRNTIGDSYRELALYDAAQRMHEPALALARSMHSGDHADTVTAITSLAMLRLARGDLAGAESLFRESLEMTQRLSPGDRLNLAIELSNLASVLNRRGNRAAAESLARESLAMRRRLFAPDSIEVAEGLSGLASILGNRDDLASAESLYREALGVYQRHYTADHPDIALALNNVAAVVQSRGDLAGAEALYREALAIRRRLHPNDHPDVAMSLNNLASVQSDRSNFADAEVLYREALAIRQRLFSGDHPNVATSLNNVGSVLQDQGKLDEAEPLYRQALAMNQRLYQGDHARIATSLNSLAYLLRERGDLAAAEPLYRQSLEMRQRLYGADHSSIVTSLNNLATVLYTRGDVVGAQALFQQALDMTRRLNPGDHPDVALALNNLATLLQDTDLTRAEPLLREAMEIRRRVLGPDNPQSLQSAHKLAAVLIKLGRYAEAVPIVEACIDGYTQKSGPAHIRTLTVIELAKNLYMLWDKADPGKGHDAKAAEWKTKLEQLQATTRPAATSQPASSQPTGNQPASSQPAVPPASTHPN